MRAAPLSTCATSSGRSADPAPRRRRLRADPSAHRGWRGRGLRTIFSPTSHPPRFLLAEPRRRGGEKEESGTPSPNSPCPPGGLRFRFPVSAREGTEAEGYKAVRGERAVAHPAPAQCEGGKREEEGSQDGGGGLGKASGLRGGLGANRGGVSRSCEGRGG